MRKLCLLVALLALAAPAPAATVRTFATALTGANAFPNTGSPDGVGIATVTLEDTGLTWSVWVNGIDTPLGIAIRKGPPGALGPIVADFGALNFSAGFAAGFTFVTTSTLDDLFANPAGYYINVTTRNYPGGALRGQLDSGAAGVFSYTTVLSGENEVPIPTTRRISGGATVTLSETALRYTVVVDGALAPTRVVLQRGLAGTNGPVVLDLGASFTHQAATGLLSIPADLADEIRAHPSGFYVNVLSVDFPDGAIRGQLAPTDPVTVYVPTVAKAEGANGTRFVSDLRIYNPASSKATLRIDYFAPSDGAAGPADTRTIQVESGAHAVLDDVVGSLFGTAGAGALRIESDRFVVVTSRVLNDLRPAGQGTTGLLVPSFTLTEAPRNGSLLFLSNGSLEDIGARRGFRTNIGYFNPGAATVHLALQARKNDGTVIGTANLTLGPYARAQAPVFDLIASTPANERAPADFYVTFTSDGPVFVYAAVVDNFTGDGVFVPGASAR